MIWKLGKLYLLLTTLGVHLLLYGFMLTASDPEHPDYTWVFVTIPFADAGVLGFWLVAGSARPWLRMMTSIAGLSSILAIMLQAIQIYPVKLATALAATMSLTAVGTLLLGCIAGHLPGWRGWRVKFALWEILLATCLVGVVLAALQTVLVDLTISWKEWNGDEGGEFLLFSVTTGVFLAIAGLPVLASGWKVRIYSISVSCFLLATLPFLEVDLFLKFGMGMPNMKLLYVAHLLQIGFAWGTLIPLRQAIPSFVAMAGPETQPEASTAEDESPRTANHLENASANASDDFLEMQ